MYTMIFRMYRPETQNLPSSLNHHFKFLPRWLDFDTKGVLQLRDNLTQSKEDMHTQTKTFLIICYIIMEIFSLDLFPNMGAKKETSRQDRCNQEADYFL